MLQRILELSALRSSMAKNASWLLAGQGVNLFLRTVCFILLARLLGVTQYGLFAGAFALVNMAAPYSDLGFGMLFMSDVSGDRSTAKSCLGNALLATVVASTAICMIAVFSGPFLTGVKSRTLFVVLTISNCLFMQITLVASRVFQIYEKMRLTATLQTIVNVVRLAAVIAMLVSLHRATALDWALASMFASGCAAGVAFVWVWEEVGGISFHPLRIVRRIWEGMQFSLSGSAVTIYNDVDKTMLSHYGWVKEDGFYSLAYRIIDLISAPIQALAAASLPRYFHLSRTSLRAMGRLVRKTVRTGFFFATAAIVVLLVFSPVIPKLVGRDFSSVIVVLRWLCLIPIFRSIHMLTGSALTGAGRQGIRTSMQVIVALLNIGLNFWWIPRRGWVGAAESSLICDGLLAVSTASVVFLIMRNSPPPQSHFPLAI